ncbi:Retrovirus-related Pol polyprotein from type-1 retrotransposable element R2 [Exaiptasia diaphana]|nr:Retrovirus-related Pol polyprotein from type-1 retrotransposable element R2 [Exaiptasia diaphana]
MDFFTKKIHNLKEDLSTSTLTTADSSVVLDTPLCKSKFSEFSIVTVDYVHDMIMKSKTKTCNPDPIPTKVVKQSIGVLATPITNIINTSLSSEWRTVLTSNGEVLGEVDIKRGIFQGDSLSPLLFVLAMVPLTMLLKRETIGYRFGSGQQMMNHLLFMDDLKLYGRSEEELEKLVDVVHVFSRDIGMEFGLDKCAVLILKQGSKVHCEGILLPDGKEMSEMDESGYKYLGVLEGADIMQKEMKQKVRDEYLRRVKLVAKSKLYGGNLIKAINAWAVSVVRYSAGILDWSDRELKEMDVKTRKRLTMFGTFHKKGSVPRLYMKRKHGGRGLISVVDCVREEELGLCGYVKASEEWMLKVVGEMVEVGETKKEYKKRVQKERRENFMQKRLHGKFMRDVSEVADERSWQWLRAGYLGKGTEGFVFAAQEQALRTRFFRATIQKEAVDPKCRVCGKEVESVGHLASGCSGLAQKEYRRRHDRMGLRVYWELCRKYGVKCADVWYKEVPDEVRVSEDGQVEIWWDRGVETTQKMEHNRPDVTVLNRVAQEWTFVDFSVPWDKNVVLKEDEKVAKYAPLAKEIRKMHRVSTKVVPLVVGCLGVVSSRFVGYLKVLGIPDVLGGMQTCAVIGTTLILQKVLSV